MNFNNKVQITRFIPKGRREVFGAFTKPESLEEWCYPENFKLSVPEFNAKKGGKYQYVHTGSDGKYVCTGEFQEFIPNEKLVYLDTVVDPNGIVLFSNLKGTVYFRDRENGTEINVTQEGFKNKEDARNCEQGWTESLNHLANFLSRSGQEHAKAS